MNMVYHSGVSVVERALASHQYDPSSHPRVKAIQCTSIWVEFVVDSHPCFEGFSPGSPPSKKNNISKFQFDLESAG